MGKWTPNGIDYVLAGKMKTVVDRVNARMEPGAPPTHPTISYEQFVEELDLGDSFTSVLFEALVKEMAERRKRKDVNEKRMISRRTQRLLENLHHSTRLLRDSSRGGHVSGRRSLYSSWNPMEFDEFSHWIHDTDVDELAANRPSVLGIGGAAVDDTEDGWDDAPFDVHLSPPATRELHDSYYPSVRPAVAAGLSPSAAPTGGNTHGSSASGATVTRQASLRRSRHRLDAFNEYTARRRVTARAEAEATPANERALDGTSGSMFPSPPLRDWSSAPPPWTVSAGVSVGSSSRAVSGTSRLRRLQQIQASVNAAGAAAAAAPHPSFNPDSSMLYLLRSVSPTPAPIPPPADALGSRSTEIVDLTEPSAQLLTPRSTTPIDDPSHPA
ncbi:hypothetical protein BKA62DRAFT_698102 [Auriculariales sp. MPI-PUGE-AT-0066]|nr:hypothetical protein BKA62DRAFT_698102 [Auriculariales sp. MPI-PUGE-AT-0066]